MTKTADAAFGEELGIFRTEDETAQQPFFAYLSARELAASNHDVLEAMNTPLFWLTTYHAMLLAAFVGLGRVFDQQPGHNIDRLMVVNSKDLTVFSTSALAKRKQGAGLSIKEAGIYVTRASLLDCIAPPVV